MQAEAISLQANIIGLQENINSMQPFAIYLQTFGKSSHATEPNDRFWPQNHPFCPLCPKWAGRFVIGRGVTRGGLFLRVVGDDDVGWAAHEVVGDVDQMFEKPDFVEKNVPS
jgi:hypothetical protein